MRGRDFLVDGVLCRYTWRRETASPGGNVLVRLVRSLRKSPNIVQTGSDNAIRLIGSVRLAAKMSGLSRFRQKGGFRRQYVMPALDLSASCLPLFKLPPPSP